MKSDALNSVRIVAAADCYCFFPCSSAQSLFSSSGRIKRMEKEVAKSGCPFLNGNCRLKNCTRRLSSQSAQFNTLAVNEKICNSKQNLTSSAFDGEWNIFFNQHICRM
jgi:hypothetical protein